MLRANGWRILRITVERATLAKSKAAAKDPAGYVRAACVRKGLVLSADGINPAMPFRYREVRKDVYEFEQLQLIDGTLAGAPPEQPTFFERFLAGEPWGGVVKSAKI